MIRKCTISLLSERYAANCCDRFKRNFEMRATCFDQRLRDRPLELQTAAAIVAPDYLAEMIFAVPAQKAGNTGLRGLSRVKTRAMLGQVAQTAVASASANYQPSGAIN